MEVTEPQIAATTKPTSKLAGFRVFVIARLLHRHATNKACFPRVSLARPVRRFGLSDIVSHTRYTTPGRNVACSATAAPAPAALERFASHASINIQAIRLVPSGAVGNRTRVRTELHPVQVMGPAIGIAPAPYFAPRRESNSLALSGSLSKNSPDKSILFARSGFEPVGVSPTSACALPPAPVLWCGTPQQKYALAPVTGLEPMHAG